MAALTPAVSAPIREVGVGVSDTVLRAEAERLGLALLVLFGSRARGDAHPGSDWDFATLAASPEQVEETRAALSVLLQTDQIDVVDLGRAGGLIRHRVASEGRLVYEDARGKFIAFQLAATQIWCDMEPILRRVHADILRELKTH